MKVLRPFLIAIALGLTGAYCAYVYLLQTSGLSSPLRLVAAAVIWVSLSAYVWQRASWLRLLSRPPLLGGLAAAFVLANLALAAAVAQIPYTRQLLPSRSIRIQPLSTGLPVTIESFSTELADGAGIDSFQSSQGWREEKRGISLVQGRESLEWVGKPGQFAVIELMTCSGCGTVEISFDNLRIEQIDLNRITPERTHIIRYEFPSLILHRALNFAVLQIAVLLLAAMLLDAGRALLAGSLQDARQPQAGEPKPEGAMPYLVIVSFAVVVYALKLQPILFNDDWCQIVSSLNFDTMEMIMLGERRPLHMFLPWLLDSFLPLEQTIIGLHLLLVGISIVTAILFYHLVQQLTGDRSWLALLAALLWLIFPNDYTHAYITMTGIRPVYLVTILVMMLTLRYIRQGGFLTLLLASACLFASFFFYEGQLGLAVAWPLLCLYLYRKQFKLKRAPGLLLYAAAIGAFIAWRVIIQPAFYDDSKLAGITLDAGVIFSRYIQALPTILGGFRFPFPNYPWASAVVFLILAAGSLGLAFLTTRKFWNRANSPEDEPVDFRILISGIVLWLAGYIPIILNYPPNIYGHLSRVNIFSIPGAVMVLLYLTLRVTASLTSDRRRAAAAASALLMPLLLAGAGVQLQVQDSNLIAWEEAKGFYRALTTVVPDVAPGTEMVVLLSGIPDTGSAHRPIFTSSWEASCAVRTLYDQPELRVMYRYETITVPPFPAMNVLAGAMETDTIGELNEISRLLILEYDRSTRTLSIRQQAGSLLPVDSDEGYAPEKRILPLERYIESRNLIR